MIWIARHRLIKEPMFHHAERLMGAGRSIKEEVRGLVSGWVFRVGCISPKTNFNVYTEVSRLWCLELGLVLGLTLLHIKSVGLCSKASKQGSKRVTIGRFTVFYLNLDYLRNWRKTIFGS